MSDTQAAMREFRFLDDKRKGGGLSHIEEQRWIDLGGQLGMSAQQGYYGPDGVWYAYPPGYDPNTGQYYGQQQPQYPSYAAPPQQPYYDPNAGYYPPQPQQGYDPNAGYYDPNQQQAYDPNAQADYDPLAAAYAPQQPQQPQQPYVPQAAWSHDPHPQAPGEWPQGYDPNTGQYYDPSGYQQPAPSQPQYAPPQPAWQPPAPAYQPPAPAYQPPAPAYQPPAPAYQPPAPEPIAAAQDEGPLEVGEDEVMEVTDDDVTLLDSTPPISTATPARVEPHRPFDAEKPLTSSGSDADMFGDLRSSLVDEPASAAPLLDVEPLLDATPEPVAAPEIPVDLMPDIAAEPSLPVNVMPEVAAEPAPSIAVDLMPEIATAPSIPVDLMPEIAAEPAPVEPSIPVDLMPEIAAEPAPVEPSIPVDLMPAIAAEPAVVVAAATVESSIPVDLMPAIAAEPEPLIPVDLMPEIAAEPAPVDPSIPVDLLPEIAAEPEPSIPVDLMPEIAAEPAAAAPVEPSIPVDVMAELPVDVIPDPVATTPVREPPAGAEVIPPERPTIPDLSKLQPPAGAIDAQPVIEPLPNPAATIPDISRASEVAFEPEIEEEIEVAPPDEMPSIMVADDLGAESFSGPARAKPVDEEDELPSLSDLSNRLGGSQPEPVAPPLALTKVAPDSATIQDLYPDGPPVPTPAAPPPPPPAPVSFDFDGDAIPEPRPSIPISIQVEEPVQEGSFDVEPILEASVEPEPSALPSFAASFDDIPAEVELEQPVSNHTGFEASLGDLPPAIANEPPPPIVDVDFLSPPPSVPMVDFDVSIDDKPLPVEVPMDLGGDAGDKLELAKTSDFLDFPASSSAESSSFSVEGESLVESGTLATMANPVSASSAHAPIDLPPEEPDMGVPLASNSDFLGMSELNNTGEAWTKRDTSVSLAEEPLAASVGPEPEEEDIIQGVALEDDALNSEIQAELAEAIIEPEPWPPAVAAPPPARSMPPPPPAYTPSPPAAAARPPAPAPVVARPPAPFVPSPPVRQSTSGFIPSPPVRDASPGFAPVSAGRDLSLFETRGSLLREDSGAPVISGEHRVILHTVEGQVKRGVLRDTKLDDETVGLEAQPGAIERIPRPRIKAIFFMLPAGQKAPPPKGDKLRVTFKDGRQLAGFSSDHRGTGIGFFVVPADNRTNTERIFIYRSSVEKVAVD